MNQTQLTELNDLVQHLLVLATKPFEENFAAIHQGFELLAPWLSTTTCHSSPELLLDALKQEPSGVMALQHMRAHYEICMEQRQAREMLASTTQGDNFRPYVDQHWPNTAIHSAAFQRQVRDRKSCLLIGCGALPSTALLLLHHTALQVTCMDCSPDSCRWAQRVMARSTQADTTMLCEDALERTNFHAWDVVFVAALAGVGTQHGQLRDRQALIQHLLSRTPIDSLLCLRSASGWGRLIYPTVPFDQLAGYCLQMVPAPVMGRSDLVLVSRVRHQPL